MIIIVFMTITRHHLKPFFLLLVTLLFLQGETISVDLLYALMFFNQFIDNIVTTFLIALIFEIIISDQRAYLVFQTDFFEQFLHLKKFFIDFLTGVLNREFPE
jgi:hypothetical protein